jgi:hypothetical protein
MSIYSTTEKEGQLEEKAPEIRFDIFSIGRCTMRVDALK